MSKEPLKFRAIQDGRAHGALSVQFSRDGSVWHGSLDGLSTEDVRTQFTRLKKHGATIVDTKDYQHERA